MPCKYESYDQEEVNPGNQAALDKLTRENDQLREVILNLVSDRDYEVPKNIWTRINRDQIEHRKADLKRLEAVFIKRKDTDALTKVWAANPEEPLEPQLGFDPDKF